MYDNMIEHFEGFLTNELKFINSTYTSDGAGGYTKVDTEFYIDCYIDQASSTEIEKQYKLGNRAVNLIICKYDSRITENTKVEVDGELYNCDIPSNTNRYNDFMEIISVNKFQS